jgi:ribosomal protein S18 acetylase RimI-like enzyme
VISRGRRHDPSLLPGFVAEIDGGVAGLITYLHEGDSAEIVTLDAVIEGQGIGSALIRAAVDAVREAGCRRMWLITTNDNTPALRFYQKQGFTLAALHRNALEETRRLKPELPLTGIDGIPLRDEIELEMLL